MAKAKKNGTYLNVCIDAKTYEALSELCKEAGQTKTIAVERAISDYINIYKKQKKLLLEMEAINEQERI